MVFTRILGPAVFLAVQGLVFQAVARECTSSGDTACWAWATTQNMCQVAVGATSSGIGIACAVVCAQPAAWGGSIKCYTGTSQPADVEEVAYAGQFIGDTDFDEADPNKRIVALAISGRTTSVGIPLSNDIKLHVLRSDGQVFEGIKTLPIQGDPTIQLSRVPNITIVPRSLSSDDRYEYLLVSTSNKTYRVGNIAGIPAVFSLGSDIQSVLVAGRDGPDADPPRDSVVLWGTSGTSRNIRTLGGTVLPNLPHALTGGKSDPNDSFYQSPVNTNYGRQMPLAVGGGFNYEHVLALLPGTCGVNSACITRLRREFGTWATEWHSLNLGSLRDPAIDPTYPMPYTIQDGYVMHHRTGEIWVIAGYEHLRFYVP